MYKTVDKLRFAKVDNNKNTQKVYKEYYRDLIESYGVDLIYFRKDSRFYNQNSLANLTYGEDTTSTHVVSAPVVGFMTVNADSYVLNKFGIEASTNGEIFLGVEEFEEQFVDILGTPTSSQVSFSFDSKMYNWSLERNELYTSDNINFQWPLNITISEPLSGAYSGSASTSGVTGVSKTVNELLEFKNRYSYTRDCTGQIDYHWSADLDENGDGTVSISGSGIVWHNIYIDSKTGGSQNSWKIAPRVGDFFRLVEFQAFDNGDQINQEEYEVTVVYDRNVTTSGINPLLGTYIWKLGIVRRDASSEEVVGPVFEENQTTSKVEHNIWADNISDTIFEYDNTRVDVIDGKDSDAIYGNY